MGGRYACGGQDLPPCRLSVASAAAEVREVVHDEPRERRGVASEKLRTSSNVIVRSLRGIPRPTRAMNGSLRGVVRSCRARGGSLRAMVRPWGARSGSWRAMVRAWRPRSGSLREMVRAWRPRSGSLRRMNRSWCALNRPWRARDGVSRGKDGGYPARNSSSRGKSSPFETSTVHDHGKALDDIGIAREDEGKEIADIAVQDSPATNRSNRPTAAKRESSSVFLSRFATCVLTVSGAQCRTFAIASRVSPAAERPSTSVSPSDSA